MLFAPPAVVLTGNVKLALSKTLKPLTSLRPVSSPISALYTTEALSVVSWLRTHAQPFSQLGIDTETRPSFQKGEVHKCALLQIATSAGNALVLPLLQLSPESWTEIRPQLERVFSDRSILKLGVAVRQDVKKLIRDWDLNVNLDVKTGHGCLDISSLAKLAEQVPQTTGGYGLRALAAQYLDLEISKTYRTANWASHPLTMPMAEYAVRDAWLGIAIFEKLQTRLGPQIIQEEIHGQQGKWTASVAAKQAKENSASTTIPTSPPISIVP